MIELLLTMGLNKYDTWRILPVKCYIDNSVHSRGCIRNVNIHLSMPSHAERRDTFAPPRFRSAFVTTFSRDSFSPNCGPVCDNCHNIISVEGPPWPLPNWIAALSSLCLNGDEVRGPVNIKRSSRLNKELAILGYFLEASGLPPNSIVSLYFAGLHL
jgi:hypothetical protein